jgi:hypothetical protein
MHREKKRLLDTIRSDFWLPILVSGDGNVLYDL